MTRRLLSLALILGACSPSSDVEVGPGGELLAGGERATATEVRGVELGSRTLVLDGFAGRVEIVEVDSVRSARIAFERVARGRTALAAQQKLDRIAIEEAGDGSTYTFRMTAAQREGAEVNVQAEVPRNTGVTVRIDRGRVELRGVSGDVNVSVAAGGISATGLAGRRVALESTAGGVEIGAGIVPDDADWQAETDAGAISFSAPASASAEIDAETTTGSIRVVGLEFSDRRLDRSGTGMRFQGTLGDGGGRVRLRTEVGAVRLGASGE